jgi:hypothetical protein
MSNQDLTIFLIDERDLQFEKHSEMRISTFLGIKIV